jgi:lipopolysaccharide/colanic/teichoic acid biosynthesis glycosyltransferase
LRSRPRLRLQGVPLGKRLFDLALAVPGLILVSPLLLMIAALTWLLHGRPILFRQVRPGYRAAPFTLYKFSTMTEDRAPEGDSRSDAERLTRFGRFLRSFSLDELPELFNVLRGEMSLVGPRPLLTQYLARYTSEQARRHEVLPGITGWTQVNGRNANSWEQKFRFDVWYVDHWSLGLDVKILVITIWKVLRREGISQPGQATAEEFRGSE